MEKSSYLRSYSEIKCGDDIDGGRKITVRATPSPTYVDLYSSSTASSGPAQDKDTESSKIEPLSFQLHDPGSGFSTHLPLGNAVLDGIPAAREILGWCLYEFGMSGYKIVLWFFFPLLLFTLFADSRESHGGVDDPNCLHGDSASRDSRCLRVCDDFPSSLRTHEASSLRGQSSTTILTTFSASLQPAVSITAIMGASVILQSVVLMVASPFLDYGNFQKIVLGLGTGVGAVLTAMVINVVEASWWWIVGILFMFSSVAEGLASVSYDRHFSCLIRGIPVVTRLVFERVQTDTTGRTRSVNRISLTGALVGSVAIAIFALAGYVCSFQSSLVEEEARGMGYGLWLRLACFIGGLWWGLWTLASIPFLKDRPGPNFPGDVFSAFIAARHLPGIFFDTGRGSGENRNAFLVLVICFLSSISNASLFQSGALCFSARDFTKLLVLAHTFSAAGAFVFLFVQSLVSRSNRLMLLIVLLAQLVLPIYTCVGFFSTGTGLLKYEWQFLLLACVQGTSVGTLRSYTRTLFLDYIPASKAGAHLSLLAVTSRLGTFVSAAMVLVLARANASLRYVFVVNAIALAVAIVLLVNFISGSGLKLSGAIGGGFLDDDESLVPVSLISGSVIMTSSSQDPNSISSSN